MNTYKSATVTRAFLEMERVERVNPTSEDLIQLPAMLAGAAAGGSMIGQLAQLGIGLGANSVLLKYSRNAERDADLLGTRLMAKAGYNPIEMARFFEKLEGEGGSRGLQFFSSHPNPGNRVKAVEQEIRLLPRGQYNADTGRFSQIKQSVSRLPAPQKKAAAAAAAGQPGNPEAALPSRNVKGYRGGYFEISHPENWEPSANPNSKSVAFVPREGVIQGQDGQVAIGVGFIIDIHQPKSMPVNLRGDTEELVRQIISSNRDMRIDDSRESRWNGEQVILTRLLSPSPFQGQTEIDTVMTVARKDGLVYVIMITPQKLERQMQAPFESMLRSLRVP